MRQMAQNVEEMSRDRRSTILWLREVKRYLRSRPQIIASLAQPLLYLLVLGFGLGAGVPAGRAGQLPAVHRARRGRRWAILFTSIFSGIGLLWDRQFGFLKETLVAPVPRLQIMAGPHARRRDDRDRSRARWCSSSA